MTDLAQIVLWVEPSTKEKAQQYAGALGMSLSKYVKQLVEQDIAAVPDEELEVLEKMKARRAAHEERVSYPAKKKK